MPKRSYLLEGLKNGLARRAGALSICLCVLCCFLTPSAAPAAPSFTASLDRESMAVNEAATLTLSFEGGSPTKLPEMPSIANLSIEGRGQSKSISFVNGQTLVAITVSYAVTAAHEGVYVIPALAAEIDGHAVKSAPVQIRVVPELKPPPNSSNAFLKVIVPKTNVFIGEIFPVEIKLFFVALRDRPPAPQFENDGFTLGSKMPQSGVNVTFINNTRYNTVSVYTYAIPVKAGRLTLGPATMPVQTAIPNGRLDYFRRPLAEWKEITLQSEPVGMNVQPLPRENRPAGFNGAVGNFTMTVEASPTNVAVGDPITVKIQITGTGALDSLRLPNQTGWDQFKLYPPTSELQTTDNLGIAGTKTFKLTAVPQSMDMKELPGYQFSYFDPDQKSFRTLTQPPIPLTLRPSAASMPATLPASPAGGDGTPAPRDITNLKQRMGTLAQIQPPLAVRGWFILAQLVPVALWLSLLVRRRNAERLAANPQLRRQRLVDRIVRDGVKALKRAAQQNDAETFFATAFRLLQEQLGERLDRPASAITESVLEDPALVNRLPEETLAAMRELFHTLNAARYAPQSSDTELLSLAVTVEDALNVLKQLQA